MKGKSVFWALLLLGLGLLHVRGAAPPNIIFIITDDQGYGDLSSNGNPVLKTPHLDRLRAESVRFTNFQVSPTCAPTRAALLTGRHEFRNGVTHTILERERLALSAITLPQVLKTRGYATGIFGKWHLGDEAAWQPGKRGFDEVFIHGAGGIGQTYPGSGGDAPGNTYFDPAILHNGTFEKTKGYCTDVFFARAMEWIGTRQSGGPFFCWVATNAPHAPYTARPEDRALYEGKGLNPDTENFFGMIHNIDENVGRLLGRVDSLGISANTLVVMMNDNGGTAGVRVFNAGLRAGKGTPWQGGVRAFSFWRWPGRYQPADCPALTAHIDVFRTLAALGGVTLTPEINSQVEGRDLQPLLENPRAPWPDRFLVTHVGRWPKGALPGSAKYRNAAIRDARYSLVSTRGGPAPDWQLFDLQADPGQTHDLAAASPGEVSRLSGEYERWWASVQPGLVNETAALPPMNPFKELFWKQFGGGPSPEDLKLMDPSRVLEQPLKR